MTITRSFQWYSAPTADPTVSATPVGDPAETIVDYTTVAEDEGLYFHVRGTATNSLGTSAVAYSNVIGPITAAGEAYTPDAGRIVPINTLFGGRTVPPIKYYNNELDILDAEEAASDALHELMHAASPSTTAVATGRWSDPSTWSNGVPQAGYTVHIPAAWAVTFDVTTPQLKYLLIHGTFIVDPALDTKLTVDTIHSMPGSRFIIGSAAVPFPRSTTGGKSRFEIVYIGDAPGNSTRLGAMLMGDVFMYGEDITEVVTTADMAVGATSVVVDAGQDISQWKIGDLIAFPSRTVAGTTNVDAQYNRPHSYRMWDQGFGGGFTTFGTETYAGADAFYFFEPQFHLSHDEMRTITNIDLGTRTVSWSGGLSYAHNTLNSPRNWKDGTTPSIPAQVCHLTRSWRMSTGGDITDLQQRGHFMVMHSDRCVVRGGEFVNMARTSTDPSLFTEPYPAANVGTWISIAKPDGTAIGDVNNVRGRYAIHIHGTGRRPDREYAIVVNNVCRTTDMSSVPQPGWAITQHNSNALVERNIIINVRGAGIASEIGTELGQWVDNIVMWARGDGGNYGYQYRNMSIANHTGHAGVAFENQARQIAMVGNQCTSCNLGYAYMIQNTARKDIVRSPENDALHYFNPLVGNCGHSPFVPEDEWGRDTYGIAQAQIPRLDDVIMVDCGAAMAVDERNHINRADTTPGIFNNWKLYGVVQPLQFLSYTWFYDYKRFAAWGVSGGTCIFFGAKTAAFNFLDLAVDGYAALSTNHANSTGRWVDINTGATRGINELDGDTSRSPDISMEWLDSSLYTYVAPTFTIAATTRDGNTPVVTELNWAESYDALTLNVYGDIVDGLGSRKWPFWTVSTQADGNAVFLGKNYIVPTPAQLVERCGCWNDAGTWKSRLWFVDVDRLTHDFFAFSIDITHTYVDETRGLPVLLANEMAGPADAPTLPPPLFDTNKPWGNGYSTNVTPPFVFPAGGIQGDSVQAFPGLWTGERDHYGYEWYRGATKIASGRKYTYQAADVGQEVYCKVSTHGMNKPVIETPHVTVVSIPTPSSIFGAAFKDMWEPRFATELSNRKGTGLSIIRHDRIVQWKGVNGLVLTSGNEWMPYLSYDGWDGGPCVQFQGQRHVYSGDPNNESGRSSSMTLSANVTNPHFWMVVERNDLDQHENYGTGPEEYLLWSDLFDLKLFAPSSDAAQNKIELYTGSARTDFPKGSRKVIYVGRGTAGRSYSLNNSGLVADGAGSGTAGTYSFQTHHPWYAGMARYKEVCRVFVDTPVITSTQHAQMFDYLNRRFNVGG